jgi:hypothetical protein
MAQTRFRSNLRFALHKESSELRVDTPPNWLEKIGDLLSWIVYEFKAVIQNTIGDPRTITVCLTLFFMVLTALLFYPSNTWDIMSDIFIWIFDHINWGYVRFILWLLSELTIFGIGLRAFGRFSNRKLREYHKVVL